MLISFDNVIFLGYKGGGFGLNNIKLNVGDCS